MVGTLHKKVRFRGPRITFSQKQHIISYMERDIKFSRGIHTGPLGLQSYLDQWEELRLELQDLGPGKSVDQWKMVWKELKSRARKKIIERADMDDLTLKVLHTIGIKPERASTQKEVAIHFSPVTLSMTPHEHPRSVDLPLMVVACDAEQAIPIECSSTVDPASPGPSGRENFSAAADTHQSQESFAEIETSSYPAGGYRRRAFGKSSHQVDGEMLTAMLENNAMMTSIARSLSTLAEIATMKEAKMASIEKSLSTLAEIAARKEDKLADMQSNIISTMDGLVHRQNELQDALITLIVTKTDKKTDTANDMTTSRLDPVEKHSTNLPLSLIDDDGNTGTQSASGQSGHTESDSEHCYISIDENDIKNEVLYWNFRHIGDEILSDDPEDVTIIKEEVGSNQDDCNRVDLTIMNSSEVNESVRSNSSQSNADKKIPAKNVICKNIYKCGICCVHFEELPHLEKHVRIIHTGDKPIAYKLRSTVRSHDRGTLKVHTIGGKESVVKRFRCETCNYECGDGTSLVKHGMIVHNEKPFSYD